MTRTVSRTAVEILILAALGAVAAIGFWFVCVVILAGLGFSFASVPYAAYLEAAILVSVAVIMVLRNKTRNSDFVKYRLSPALGGMLAMTSYFVIALSWP